MNKEIKPYSIDNQPKRAIELYKQYLNEKLDAEINAACSELLSKPAFQKMLVDAENAHKKACIATRTPKLNNLDKPKSNEWCLVSQKDYEEFELSVKPFLIKQIKEGKLTADNYKFKLQPMESKSYYNVMIKWLGW